MNIPTDKNISIVDENIPVNEIKALLDSLAMDLSEALEGSDLEKTLAAQQTFTGAIAMLWNTAQEIDVDPKTKAISRLVADWAMTQLPHQIHDPANHATIKRELKLSQRSLMRFRWHQFILESELQS